MKMFGIYLIGFIMSLLLWGCLSEQKWLEKDIKYSNRMFAIEGKLPLKGQSKDIIKERFGEPDVVVAHYFDDEGNEHLIWKYRVNNKEKIRVHFINGIVFNEDYY